MSDEHKRKYRRLVTFRGYLRTLVALKLRELEHQYETFDQFVSATGLTSGAVFKLLRGMQNLTSDTLDTLAVNLRIPIWELLNAPVYLRNGQVVKNDDVDHQEIFKLLWKKQEFDIEKLKGGKRRDWVKPHMERMTEARRDKKAKAKKVRSKPASKAKKIKAKP